MVQPLVRWNSNWCNVVSIVLIVINMIVLIDADM